MFQKMSLIAVGALLVNSLAFAAGEMVETKSDSEIRSDKEMNKDVKGNKFEDLLNRVRGEKKNELGLTHERSGDVKVNVQSRNRLEQATSGVSAKDVSNTEVVKASAVEKTNAKSLGADKAVDLISKTLGTDTLAEVVAMPKNSGMERIAAIGAQRAASGEIETSDVKSLVEDNKLALDKTREQINNPAVATECISMASEPTANLVKIENAAQDIKKGDSPEMLVDAMAERAVKDAKLVETKEAGYCLISKLSGNRGTKCQIISKNLGAIAESKCMVE